MAASHRIAPALAAGLLCFGTGAASAWAPDDGVLRGGQAWAEVLPDTGGAALIHAAVDIPATPKIVWTVMTDCRLAARLVSNVESCRVVSGDMKAGSDVREQVTRGSLFVPVIHNVFRSDYQPYTLIRFHRVGGDLKAEDGEWRLTAINGGLGTRVTYVNRIAANIVAPPSLVRAAMKRDTPKVLMNLRRESLAAAKG